MRDFPEFFDLSNMPSNNRFGITPTRKIDAKLGTFKAEYADRILIKWACLSAKGYCSVFEDGAEERRAKGVKRCVLDTELQFEDFERCLRDCAVISRQQCTFRSKKHRIFTVNETKVCLKFLDLKRQVSDIDFCSKPYGYFSP